MTTLRSPDEIRRIARDAGFRVDAVETVAHLLSVLTQIAADPCLRACVALKGGTAINLFELQIPRLSVDIDLNYVGHVDRREAEKVWPDVHERFIAAYRAAGVRSTGSARRVHALWSFTGRFIDCERRRQPLKVELNHQHRAALWPVVPRDSIPFHGLAAFGVPVADVHETCAGKLVALLDRTKPRDLFDAPRILELDRIDVEKVRKGVVALSAGTKSLDLRRPIDLRRRVSRRDVEVQLRPVVQRDAVSRIDDWGAYADGLVAECEAALRRVLPLRSDEHEFLDRLLDHGEVRVETLEADDAFRRQVAVHPAVLWRADTVARDRECGGRTPPTGA